MASTNPLLHDSVASLAGVADVERQAEGGRRPNMPGAKPKRQKHRSRGGARKLREMTWKSGISGWPEFDGLKPVLTFLAIPAFLVLAITISGVGWPKFILYPIAMALGVVVAFSAFRGVELVLAVLLIYLPFSKIYVVPLAPGINATNVLILLGIFAAVLRLMATRQKLTEFHAGAYLVFAFGALTSLSAITISQFPGGRVYLLYNEILSFKAWVDQFIFYFIVLMCVRDVQTAKRCIIYVMIGSALVVLYSIPEMLDKAGRSTIEKSRIGGPHLQSNNFGGFVAYTVLPLIALFVIYIKDVRAWLLTPYFLLTIKVLITTFSRGAYLAVVVGGFLVAWLKGKQFLAWWAAAVLSLILIFPSVIPDSILARMDTFTNQSNSAASTEEQLDKSSAVRLIMWRAGAQMMLESPWLGKGFKGFQLLKDDYTEVPVEESDPHSMYLYIGSQMGIPALSLFLVILGYSYWLGVYLSKNTEDRFIKVIGIGGAAATACFAVVCIFGSRAVSLNFTVYFWTFLVVMQVLRQKQLEAEAAKNPKRKRTNAFEIAKQNEEADLLAAMAPDETAQIEHQASQVHLDMGWKQLWPGKKERSNVRGAAAHNATLAAKALAEASAKANLNKIVHTVPARQNGKKTRDAKYGAAASQAREQAAIDQAMKAREGVAQQHTSSVPRPFKARRSRKHYSAV